MASSQKPLSHQHYTIATQEKVFTATSSGLCADHWQYICQFQSGDDFMDSIVSPQKFPEVLAPTT